MIRRLQTISQIKLPPGTSHGFTLIEIVIVIAIAALILAAVLIFVPQVQASQRDSQRRAAAGKILSKEAECAANLHSGATCTAAEMNANYMTNIFMPGTTTAYTAVATTPAPTQGATCTTVDTLDYTQAATSPKVTAAVCLENGGAGATHIWYVQSTQ